MPGKDSSWKPSHSPWLIAVAVMIATFMEVMDTSIASVAVPYIAGSTASTNDEAEWVLTVYLVANAVFLVARKAGASARSLRVRCGPGAGDWPRIWRVSYRRHLLALGLLHQRADRLAGSIPAKSFS
jgi:MFS family permease